MKPICFKIRGGVEREDGSRGSTNIGKQAGKGYLGSEDRAFTVATVQDQYLFAGKSVEEYSYPFNTPPMNDKKLKYLSLFSGIEAASVAWSSLGWECVGFSEIEPFPSAVLAHHYPTTKNYGDITKWKDWGLVPGSVDLVCAGSPCQAFSTAGLRKGLDDPRGNLALITLGLVEHLKPRWFIWENVPGVLTSGGQRGAGSDFAAFITALGNIGYGFAWRILDAQHFGVAQRRKRVWLCAYRDPVTGAGDWRPPAAVLFDRKSLCRDLEKGGEKRKGSAADAGSRFDESGLQTTVGCLCADTHPGAYSGQDAYTGRLIPSSGVHCSKVAPSLTSSGPPFSRTGNQRVESDAMVAEDMRVRRLTERECERLQGFKDDYTKISWKGKPPEECPAGLRYKAIGNSWAVPCAKWIGERIQIVESILDEKEA
jgi:DNA (cytosine-5)-methyltransferase 1